MILPSPSQRVLDERGHLDPAWRRALDQMARNASSSGDTDVSAQIAAIATALGSPDGSVENIPDQPFLPATTNVFGQGSIQTFGLLKDGTVFVTLYNDVSNPGVTHYYGTDAAGEQGWFPASDTVEAEVGELTKTVDPDTGVTTFGLEDVTPEAGGTLQKTTFDAKGRRSEEDDATTDDLLEGDENLYYTDERADARIDLQKGQPDGLATLDGDAKLQANQLPALAITDTFVVADEPDMLAADAQQGDVAVRTDEQKSYILTAEPASTLGNWQELLSPTGMSGTVTSVDVSAPTGLTSSGGPITSSGTIVLGYDAGYQGYTSAESSKLSGIAAGATANTGTVTSVNLGSSTGLAPSGGPITGSGTLTYTLSANLQAWHGFAPADAGLNNSQGSRITNASTPVGGAPLFWSALSSATDVPVSANFGGVYLPVSATGGVNIAASVSGSNPNQFFFQGYTSGSGNGWIRLHPISRPTTVQNGNFTLNASMIGTAIGKNNGTASTVTVPANVFQNGDSIRIRNANTTGSMSIVRGSGLAMFIAGNTTNTDATLAPRGFADIEFTSATVCYISGPGVS